MQDRLDLAVDDAVEHHRDSTAHCVTDDDHVPRLAGWKGVQMQYSGEEPRGRGGRESADEDSRGAGGDLVVGFGLGDEHARTQAGRQANENATKTTTKRRREREKKN